jgi:pilus assembly protein FimV
MSCSIPKQQAVWTMHRSMASKTCRRLPEQVVARWPAGDVIGYLNQLLRDNRGGTRLGFSLPVVSDILFLIELKEISNKMESETRTS